MILPTQKSWSVAHGQDGFADIVRTRNMDFDRKGIIKLAKQPIVIYSNTQDADFGVVKSIVNYYNDSSGATEVYVVTSGNVFLVNTATGAITEQTNTNSPDILGTASDALAYDGSIYVSAGTTLTEYLPGTGWGVSPAVTGLSAFGPHPLCVFENRQTLCIGDAFSVWQSTAGTETKDSANSLTLPGDYVVTWMRWRGNNLYIGTRSISGGPAMMFIWNGSGTSAQAGYPINGEWIYSGCVYNDTMVVLSSTGQLLRFNGGGFTEIAHFPVYETTHSWNKRSASFNSTVGRCENRGMVAEGDIIYINIDGSVQGNPEQTYLPNQPSGLWVYDPNVGLYHKSGHVYQQYATLTITALASNTLTVGTHSLETGDQIRAVSVSNITGLTAARDYFAVRVSTTTIKLALSQSDAYAGRTLTLSGSPSGDTLAANRTNLGAVSTVIPGAIGLVINANINTPFFGEGLLFSGTAQNNANTAIKSLMALGVGRNVGHFVTSQLSAGGVKTVFQKLYLNLKSLFLDTDSIVIKYRKVNKLGLPSPFRLSDTGLATWVDGSTFTVLTTAKDFKSASVGDEIEFIEGAAAGRTAHITSIDSSTSTYSVIIDEVMPNITVGDTSDFVVDNWTKLATITNTKESIVDGFAEVPVGQKGSWIQFKVELRGKNVPVDKLSIITTADKPT